MTNQNVSQLLVKNSIVDGENGSYLKGWLKNQDRIISKRISDMSYLLGLCESPLEKVLFMELVASFGGKPLLNSYFTPPHVHTRLIYPFTERFVAKIIPQCHVATDTNKYRVDFLVSVERFEQIDGGIGQAKHLQIIIEVDGHEFHEKTKEQAQRDKLRDRELQKLGYVIFRYTGSEIYKNAQSIATDIEDYVSKKAMELVASKGA